MLFQDNLRNRYIIKVGSSALIAVFNIIIQLILPRVFSLTEFGFYSYNLNLFTSIVVLANLSASNAMVAKFSKRNEEIGLVKFYLKFYAAMTLILTALILFIYPTAYIQEAFGGQTIFVIMLGLQVAVVNKLLTDCISMYDASAVSRFPAFMQIILKVLLSFSVIIGYLFGKLSLSVFYIFQVSITSLIIFILLKTLIRDQRMRYPIYLDKGIMHYAKEYWNFCSSLVLAGIFAQIVVIIMNWALMRWSGAGEQALFGAAWQFNLLLSYIFSPYAEVMKREFAVLQTDSEVLAKHFHFSLKLIFWLTAFPAIFIATFSDWILPLIYGDKYSNATLVTVIIMFYTIYQAWGQLTGSFFIATEKTKANAIIGIVGQILTLVFVFLFQIPNFIWKESLGSTGIALNYFIVNIICVTISISYISNYLKKSILSNLSVQFAPLILCLLSAHVFKTLFGMVTIEGTYLLAFFKTIFAGICYSLFVALMIYIWPSIIELSREDLKNKIKNIIKDRFKTT